MTNFILYIRRNDLISTFGLKFDRRFGVLRGRVSGLLTRPQHSETETETKTRDCETETEIETKMSCETETKNYETETETSPVK